MASNHSEKHNQQDPVLRKKLLSLQQEDYNTRKGWDRLAFQLENRPVKKVNEPHNSWRPFLKMAAAVILLAAGFLAGRLSSRTDPSLPGQMVANSPIHYDSASPPADKVAARRTDADLSKSLRKKAKSKAASASSDKAAPVVRKKYYASGRQHRQRRPVKKPLEIVTPAPSPVNNISRYASGRIDMKSSDQVFSHGVKTVDASPPATSENKAEKTLPVIGIAQISTIPSLPIMPPEPSARHLSKESVYQRLNNSSGSSVNNPFKIRF